LDEKALPRATKHVSQASLGILDSRSWKWIYHSKDSALSRMSKQLSNGQNSLLWYDNWLPRRILIDQVDFILVSFAACNVAHLVVDGFWHMTDSELLPIWPMIQQQDALIFMHKSLKLGSGS